MQRRRAARRARPQPQQPQARSQGDRSAAPTGDENAQTLALALDISSGEPDSNVAEDVTPRNAATAPGADDEPNMIGLTRGATAHGHGAAVTAPHAAERDELADAVREGDEAAFTALVERYRYPLRVHCYRMLGSFDEAEDLVQETLLRAWRGRAGFAGRALARTWLYRIATNACLNALERGPGRARRRVLPQDVAAPVTASTPAGEARAQPAWAPEIPWLQPFPDHLLEPPAPPASEPEAMAVRRETIELVFLAALQYLPPRQRAILILRDALDWSAKETAALLETSVASVNSAHQRARATMRAAQPAEHAVGRTSPAAASEQERAVLATFMAAWERADADRLLALLCEDARWAMPPAPLWFDGRAAIARLLELFPIDWQGRCFRLLATAANRQPAAAAYLRPAGASSFGLSAVHVLRVEGDRLAEITTFGPALCGAFGLPPAL